MSNAALNARSDAILSAQEELASPESGVSAVSWAAIIAGAVVASALSLALLMLGAGIGLVSVSPWSTNNVSVTTFGILAAAWFIAVQLFSSGVGGYLAGRLRTRWVSVHTDEVYFRDTAHGLIVWGVGAIVTAWLLTSGAASVVSGAAHAGGSALEAAGTAVGGPAAQAAGQAASSEGSSTAYFTDMLFRADHPDTSGDPGRGAGRGGTNSCHRRPIRRDAGCGQGLRCTGRRGPYWLEPGGRG